MGYIAVEDIDAAVKKTPELGGTVLHGPQEVPGVGRFAIIQDPTGAGGVAASVIPPPL